MCQMLHKPKRTILGFWRQLHHCSRIKKKEIKPTSRGFMAEMICSGGWLMAQERFMILLRSQKKAR